jgi:hypothetical protein
MKPQHYLLIILSLPFALILAYLWVVCVLELAYIWKVIIENGKPYLFKEDEITRFLAFFVVTIQVGALTKKALSKRKPAEGS